jgi:hypothetical protein
MVNHHIFTLYTVLVVFQKVSVVSVLSMEVRSCVRTYVRHKKLEKLAENELGKGFEYN